MIYLYIGFFIYCIIRHSIDSIIARKLEIDKAKFKKMLVPQLRSLCEAKGIQWKNYRGKRKHMLKADMVASLAIL